MLAICFTNAANQEEPNQTGAGPGWGRGRITIDELGHGYYVGHGYGGGFYGGGRYYGGHGYYGGRGYYGPRHYGGGFGLGFYAAPGYGYAAPVCNPAGFYDQGGYWHYYRGCNAAPYGY